MSSISGLSPVTQFINASKDEATSAATYIKTNASDKRVISDFQKNAPNIKTADQLMNDYSSNQVVLGAYNLSQLSGEKAIEKQLLTQDPTDSKSLAKTSNNASWLAFANAFSTMGKNKGTATDSPFTQDAITSAVSNYEQGQYEQSDALKKNGVGDALHYTKVMASGKIKSLDDIMSDAALLRVVEVNNNLNPNQFGALDYDQQKRILSKKLDITKLTDSKNIRKNAEQYLTNLQVHPEFKVDDDNSSVLDLFGGGDNNDVLSLFGGSSSGNPLVDDLF